MSDSNPAGWQPDPTGRHEHRYWDGTSWTDNISDAGVAGTDPFAAPAPPVADPTASDVPVPPTTPTPPADTTAAWSATPPPVAAGGATGGGSSKKGLLIGGGILAVVAVVVAALLLGGGDDDEEDQVRSDLVSALSAPDQGDLSQADAECVADQVMDDVDTDVLAGIDYDSEDMPVALQPAFLSAFQACDVNLGGGSTDDTDTTERDDGQQTPTTESSPDDDGSIDELPDDITEQLADIYESSMGLTRDQAECLADRIGEVVQSGDLSEDQAMSEIFAYLSDCDISMSDIGAN